MRNSLALLLVAVLLVVGLSTAAPTELETTAKVVETPPRVMTVQPLSTFNHGKPFLAERNPLTGAFDLKTTPVNADDYFYEEFEDSGEAIDRKDEKTPHSANHIISIPAKDSELHKFLNLPVHYASSSKFPLISSSYANTKIQGHGVANHRPASTGTTTSTIQPSYYPHRTANLTTTTTTPTTTTSQRFSSSTTTSRPPPPPPPAYEYEYEYDYNDPKPPSGDYSTSTAPPKSDFDFMEFFNFGESSSSTSSTTRSSSTSTANPLTAEESEIVTKPAITPVTTTQVHSGTSTSRDEEATNETTPSARPPPNSSHVGNAMIAIKSDNVPARNKSQSVGEVQQTKGEFRVTDEPVIGMMPPIKTPDSVIKPPPQYGDQVEVVKNGDGGWRGKPDLPSELYSSQIGHRSPPSVAQQGQVKTATDSIQVSQTELVTKRPLEFQQHLVGQLRPVGTDDAIPPPTEPPRGGGWGSSSPSSEASVSHQITDSFQVIEAPQLQPQKTQVFHATVVDQTPHRSPQRPLMPEPSRDKGQTNAEPIHLSAEANKVSHRPQPGLVSSYQPQSNYPHKYQPSSHNNPDMNRQQLPYPQHVPPAYLHHKAPSQHNPPSPATEEKRPPPQPPVWPPLSKPQDSQKIPQFSFFPRPEQRPPSGVGTVEAVRAPSRLPIQKGTSTGDAADSQSYSLQTSFSIGVPSGPGGDKGKVTSGTVSSVPLGLQSSASPSLPPQATASQQLPTNSIKFSPQPLSWEGNLNKAYNKELPKRKPLPNILPQFRPNAKVGTADPSGPPSSAVNYVRAPTDRLQPPPLPQQHPRPHHRSDELPLPPPSHLYSAQPQRPMAAFLRAEPLTSTILPPQPVHRRNGLDTKVTTLQMLQSTPTATGSDDKPLMVVYPSNNAEASLKSNWRQPSPDFSNDDEFPHDLADARVKDTPILKGKPPTARPHIKVEFPYALVKPIAEDELREYQAYVPTSAAPDKAPPSDSSLTAHRLQDYRPMMSSPSSSSSSAAPTRRLVPLDGEFGWSVIGSRTVDESSPTMVAGTTTVTSPPISTTSGGSMAPPLLTGGFRPISPPNLD